MAATLDSEATMTLGINAKKRGAVQTLLIPYRVGAGSRVPSAMVTN
jgi:hypothetical protein